MAHNVRDNTEQNRFELVEDGHMAVADYRITGETLYIDYVESPPPLRGAGTAGRLMEGVMKAAADKGYAVVPICGYAAAWMRRHRQL